MIFAFRALVGIRTPNLLIRSEMLYPIELQMRFPLVRFGIAKVVFQIGFQNFFQKKLKKVLP